MVVVRTSLRRRTTEPTFWSLAFLRLAVEGRPRSLPLPALDNRLINPGLLEVIVSVVVMRPVVDELKVASGNENGVSSTSGESKARYKSGEELYSE